MSYGTFGIPQAAAPIAFALAALALTGSADFGAAVVMAMTLSQIIGAVPVARWGRRWSTIGYLRALIAVRTLALVAAAMLTAAGLPLWSVAAAAALAGLVNGAAYGNLRALLSGLVPPAHLPRSLGLAATLNEVTFAASPVLATALGAVAPWLSVAGLAVLGALPLALLPGVRTPPVPREAGPALALLSPELALWLCCGLAAEAAVAGVEIGAVSRALHFGLPPTAGVVFTVALCAASITGGVWVSVRNRPARRHLVIALLAVMVVGTVLVAGGWNLVGTVAGAVLIGFCLPPIGTHCSLMVERLAPEGQRAEAFALLRTANTLGIVVISAVLAVLGLAVAQWAGCAIIGATLALVCIWAVGRPR